MNTISEDVANRIANHLTIQECSALGRIDRSFASWWPLYVTLREELVTKFVKNLLASPYTLEETKEILKKFSRFNCDLPFELQMSHDTFKQEKFQVVTKLFSNAISIQYERPQALIPPMWADKELSGCLVTAKFATNALCNIARALPCVKAIGQEIHDAIEQEIRMKASDAALQEAHTAYPHLKKLSIIVYNTPYDDAKIARAITEIPPFKDLTALCITHKQQAYFRRALELDSSVDAFSDPFLHLEKLESLEIPHSNHKWNSRSYSQFQSPSSPFQYIPEKLTKLSITLNASQGQGSLTNLSALLKRCKNLKELTFALSEHQNAGNLLTAETEAYPALQKLTIRAPVNFSQGYSQQLFATFPNLETLELFDGQDNSFYLSNLASSSTLKHLVVDTHGWVNVGGEDIKNHFPKLETITLTCRRKYMDYNLTLIQSIEPENSTLGDIIGDYIENFPQERPRGFYVYQVRAPEIQVRN